MKRLVIIVTLCSLLPLWVQAQSAANFGKVWLQGPEYTTTFNSIGTVPDIIENPPTLEFLAGNSSICDSFGNLLLCSMGLNLYRDSSNHLVKVDGGDSLGPDALNNYYGGIGMAGWVEASILLPIGENKYYLVNTVCSDSLWNATQGVYGFDQLRYHTIDMNANGGRGKVTQPDNIFWNQANSFPASQMTACRHGNGQDWWLIKQSFYNEQYYAFQFTQNGVNPPVLSPKFDTVDRPLTGNGAQAVFSQDGEYYASVRSNHSNLLVTHFDRCTGQFSAPRFFTMPAPVTYDANMGVNFNDSSYDGIAFSPSGRFVYISTLYNVLQLDLEDSTANAWYQVGGLDTTWAAFSQYWILQLGLDNKIYLGNASGFTGAMNVISNPDSKGAACGWCRRCIRYPGWFDDGTDTLKAYNLWNPPNVPNYALGPKNCDPNAVEEVHAKASFAVYPNPTTSIIHINYQLTALQNGCLLITDMYGRIVKEQSLNPTRQHSDIELSNITSGIYYYRFLINGTTAQSGKLTLIK